ncbi:major facilitator superfamily domain-containing protein [Massariosphaeria phaeospora]|uniref:Major facilitator superfamily domain-containing protein n=1 Tax=Massariosphaeria phaeospora TaxID=100035 RepID=A0A7C8M0F0_9PLEO|nr:major facilitator superfamily domain-containing protein [Massariosphaeria phaeospora]
MADSTVTPRDSVVPNVEPVTVITDIPPPDIEEDAASTTKTEEAQPLDPNLVDWDGPNDPDNPYNWRYALRMGHVAIAGATAFFANLTATAFAPAAPSLRTEFHITNLTLSALTVTVYLLGFALGPLIIAPLSEHYGRRPVYSVCLSLSVLFLIGCSQATDVTQFLVCRLITGIAGSGPGTIGSGTIADVMQKENRGGAMAVFAVGPLLSHTIGPLMAGPVAAYLGWRWLFRIICIANAVTLLVSLWFTRETYMPVLLQRKAARLRKKTGNHNLYSQYDKKGTPFQALKFAILRPSKLLIYSPIVWSLSIYCAFVWGLLILLFTTFPDVYKNQYGFSQSNSGLAYLGMGVGMALGAASFGLLSDRTARKRRKAGQNHEELKPESRLQLMVWCCTVTPIGFFWYGWSAHYKAHWIVPITGTGFIGLGTLYIVMPIQMYLVDAFGPVTAASAIAANTVLRSLASAFLPLAGPSLYEALGLGWGNTLLGFIAVGFCALPVFFYKHGEWMRTRWPVEC